MKQSYSPKKNSSRNVAFNRMGGSLIGNQETNAANDHNSHMRDRDATVHQDVFFWSD